MSQASITVYSAKGNAQAAMSAPVVKTTPPPTSGSAYGAGQVYVDTTNATVYINASAETANFQLLNGGTGTVGISAAMTAGSVTVANTAVKATSIILAYPAVLGTVTVPSAYYISAISPGVSFTIVSSDATDTSTWNYKIFN